MNSIQKDHLNPIPKNELDSNGFFESNSFFEVELKNIKKNPCLNWSFLTPDLKMDLSLVTTYMALFRFNND